MEHFKRDRTSLVSSNASMLLYSRKGIYPQIQYSFMADRDNCLSTDSFIAFAF